MPPPPTIDLLLSLIDTRPASILTTLTTHPTLAHASDAHGYTLLHASSSYAQLDVLRALIHTYNVPINALDEDGETALFVAETEEVARCLVEELGIDWRIRNLEGKTAEEKLVEEEEAGGAHTVVVFLRGVRERDEGGSASTETQQARLEREGVQHPPPLPNGVRINMETVEEPQEEGEGPDPEFRRRIEELAAREDFQSEEGQRELRELVTEAVTGLGGGGAEGRSVRRRVD